MKDFEKIVCEIMGFFKDFVEDSGKVSITINKVLSYNFVNSKEMAIEIMSEIVSLGYLDNTSNKMSEVWLLTDIGREFVRKNLI